MAIIGKRKITVYELKCGKCGHNWDTKEDILPKVCPKCKNPNWNRDNSLIKRNKKEKVDIEVATGLEPVELSEETKKWMGEIKPLGWSHEDNIIGGGYE